jgi:hypothetical protein
MLRVSDLIYILKTGRAVGILVQVIMKRNSEQTHMEELLCPTRTAVVKRWTGEMARGRSGIGKGYSFISPNGLSGLVPL